MKTDVYALLLSDFFHELKDLGRIGAIMFALITLSGYIYISLFESTATPRQIHWATRGIRLTIFLMLVHTAMWLFIPEKETIISIIQFGHP